MKIKLLFLLCVLCLVGCSKTTYVPIESVKTEYIDRLQRDSIYLRDSIHIREKGDSVIVEKYKYLYRDVIRVDSILRIDSIPYPVEVKVPYPVERKLSKWESTKMDVGGWAIGVLSAVFIAGIIYIMVWLIRKFR